MNFSNTINILMLQNEIGKPDYTIIKKNISTKSSVFFYPKLLKKYHDLDNNNLTVEEERHLYYGYVFDEKFKPYKHYDSENNLNQVMKKDKHSEDDLNKIIKYSDSLLNYNPFDLNAIRCQRYAYDEMNNELGYRKKTKQMIAVYNAILSSGNGLSEETAFHVLYISHEYLLLNTFGLESNRGQRMKGECDYLGVKKNDENVKGVYFNIKGALNQSKYN